MDAVWLGIKIFASVIPNLLFCYPVFPTNYSTEQRLPIWNKRRNKRMTQCIYISDTCQSFQNTHPCPFWLIWKQSNASSELSNGFSSVSNCKVDATTNTHINCCDELIFPSALGRFSKLESTKNLRSIQRTTVDRQPQIHPNFEILSFEQHCIRHRAFPLGCDDTALDSFYFDCINVRSSMSIRHGVTSGNGMVYFPP